MFVCVCVCMFVICVRVVCAVHVFVGSVDVCWWLRCVLRVCVCVVCCVCVCVYISCGVLMLSVLVLVLGVVGYVGFCCVGCGVGVGVDVVICLLSSAVLWLHVCVCFHCVFDDVVLVVVCTCDMLGCVTYDIVLCVCDTLFSVLLVFLVCVFGYVIGCVFERGGICVVVLRLVVGMILVCWCRLRWWYWCGCCIEFPLLMVCGRV